MGTQSSRGLLVPVFTLVGWRIRSLGREYHKPLLVMYMQLENGAVSHVGSWYLDGGYPCLSTEGEQGETCKARYLFTGFSHTLAVLEQDWSLSFLVDLPTLHTSANHRFPHKGPFLGLSCHHRELHMQLKCLLLEACSFSTLFCPWHHSPTALIIVTVASLSVPADRAVLPSSRYFSELHVIQTTAHRQ